MKEAKLQLVVKYCFLVGDVLPHKNMFLDTLLFTGTTDIQNIFWPLFLSFQTPTYTLSELQERIEFFCFPEDKKFIIKLIYQDT